LMPCDYSRRMIGRLWARLDGPRTAARSAVLRARSAGGRRRAALWGRRRRPKS